MSIILVSIILQLFFFVISISFNDIVAIDIPNANISTSNNIDVGNESNVVNNVATRRSLVDDYKIYADVTTTNNEPLNLITVDIGKTDSTEFYDY